eukprot:Gb_33394 [translate_table: standard]
MGQRSAYPRLLPSPLSASKSSLLLQKGNFSLVSRFSHAIAIVLLIGLLLLARIMPFIIADSELYFLILKMINARWPNVEAAIVMVYGFTPKGRSDHTEPNSLHGKMHVGHWLNFLQHFQCSNEIQFLRFFYLALAWNPSKTYHRRRKATYYIEESEEQVDGNYGGDFSVDRELELESNNDGLRKHRGKTTKMMARIEEVAECKANNAAKMPDFDGKETMTGIKSWLQGFEQYLKDLEVPEFEEAAFSSPLNKPVRCKTKFGWHLLEVLAEREAGSIQNIEPEELYIKMQDHNFLNEAQLMDVREPDEVSIASLPGFKIYPLRQFGSWGPTVTTDLDPVKDTYVLVGLDLIHEVYFL